MTYINHSITREKYPRSWLIQVLTGCCRLRLCLVHCYRRRLDDQYSISIRRNGLYQHVDFQEIDYYVSQFKRSGFHGPLNWYRTRIINYNDERDLPLNIPQPALMVRCGTPKLPCRPYVPMTDGSIICACAGLSDRRHRIAARFGERYA